MKLKKLQFAFVIASIFGATLAEAQVWVQGYMRRDGTYVQGHYRTAPDNTINNNYGTQGNYNPYNGTYGTIPQNPYQSDYTGFGGYPRR